MDLETKPSLGVLISDLKHVLDICVFHSSQEETGNANMSQPFKKVRMDDGKAKRRSVSRTLGQLVPPYSV